MSLIDWSAASLTGLASIDETHQEFVELVNQLDATQDKAEFIQLFAELVAHTEAHFQRENQLMDDSGFPAIAEHKGEHQRVLSEMEQFYKRSQRGLTPLGRAYIRDRLPEWFNLHLQTMDRALVVHIQSTSGTSS